MSKRSTTKYWKTREIFIAAYLFARQGILVGIHPDENGVTFVFLDTIDRFNCIEEFRFGKPVICPRVYACAIRTLENKRLDALMEYHAQDR
jgi:hypothetical protein